MLGITLSANELRQFQIARTFTLSLAKQCHCRGIEASRTVGAIEPLDAESMEVVVEFDEFCRWYVYPRFLGESVNDIFPSSDVSIVISGRKLADPERTVGFRSEEHTSELQ